MLCHADYARASIPAQPPARPLALAAFFIASPEALPVPGKNLPRKDLQAYGSKAD
jgi:hypothetical protein